ncbi:hypothetical protein [Stutzerimonas decontaminans]|uniref:hypothetical protein n=1 Tax=Stutzerimonas decontaminans TaxID=3022791 RepID=UPI0011AF7558|nr:hypothetical protein [Stutzerimonas decontaminans]MCQ4246070.1 hypothetical protein [Stutzerimonas decontaminans]
MIYEYALEPTVLAAWASNDRDYAEFLREYGLGTPRLVSTFPKKKVSKLRSYLLQHSPQDTQSLSGRRYIEMVTKLIESVVIRDVADLQTSVWSEAVVSEDNRAPFGVILSSVAICAENNITPNSMYLPDSIWNHAYQSNMQRTNAGLFSMIGNLVRLSTKHIVIIDPFGWSDEAIGFVRYMINSIHPNRLTGEIPKITLFYKEKRGGKNAGSGSPAADHVKDRIMQGLDGGGGDLKVEVLELREAAGSDVFHNRCILTEHGGVLTGHGIGVSNNELHTDEAILMREKIYQKKWLQFVEEKCFEVVSKA